MSLSLSHSSDARFLSRHPRARTRDLTMEKQNMIDRDDIIALHEPGECPRQDAFVKRLTASDTARRDSNPSRDKPRRKSTD